MLDHENIKLFIGIDDTDNSESRGTGFHSRQLAHELEKHGYTVSGITRHQLYVNPAIRYTSQNSAACLTVTSDIIVNIKDLCEEYLIKNSAPGSDAGLCLLPARMINDKLIAWGKAAKNTVLNMEDARQIAKECEIFLQGYTGNHEGIIGALAATALRAGGNDGRFIWRKGKKELRELETGITTVGNLLKELKLDSIQTQDGTIAPSDANIQVNDWVRPILKHHKAILIVEQNDEHEEYEWKLTTKEVIRAIS